MAIAESILFQINSTNYSSGIFTIYKPQTGCSGFITTLRLTVNLNSIGEATFPYIPDDTPADVFQQILDEVAANTEFKEIILYYKKSNGDWIERAPIRIFNKDPYYDINLMRFFSDSNTIDVAEDLSIGIKLKTGNILEAADRILVYGTAVEEKKNNGNEELAARIEALELALMGKLTGLPSNTLLGRNSNGVGVVEAIPNVFTTLSQVDALIDQAIIDWVGTTPENLNTLKEISTALGNDSNFAATMTALLAAKAPLINSLQLTPRSNTSGVFDANSWTLPFFAGLKRLDGGVANQGLPTGINTGTIIQFDPLLGTSVAGKYCVQILFSEIRSLFRIQTNGTWGGWREISTVAS